MFVRLRTCLLVGLIFSAGVTSADAASAAPAPAIPAPTAVAYAGTLQLEIDATDLERRVFRVRETIPVKPGPLVLLYPEWVPGSHSPLGNIVQLTGLRVSAGGQLLAWTRDPLNVFAFHLQVPGGVGSIEAQFEWLSPLQSSQGRTVVSNEMLHLQFDHVLLYPAGVRTDGITVATRLQLPAGWSYATALETEGRSGDLVSFKPTDLTTLVDAPLMAGASYKKFELATEGGPRVSMNAFAEKADALVAADKFIASHKNMVQQAYKLFGAPPFGHYDFLLAMSDAIGGIGREHWQSTEITLPATYFTDSATSTSRSMVIPHEFVHAWIGKYRRPADLITANFNQPMQGSLLWVYEGQTQYYGQVLEVRAGLHGADVTRDILAASIASIDQRAGRSWRDLQDTTNEPVMALRSVQRPWTSWQRSGGDYYGEGAMIWLGVDARIRQLTNETKSLDDFAALFYAGGPAAKRIPRGYTFADLVATLNQVAPYDWATLLQARLSGHDDKVVREDLLLSGWKLVYNKTPNPVLARAAKESGTCDTSSSLGLSIGKADVVSGVLWDSLAFKAGITPGATLLAVNGKVFKCSDLTDAVAATEEREGTIELIYKRERDIKVLKLAYRGGMRYPHLERVADTPDRLGKILEARP